MNSIRYFSIITVCYNEQKNIKTTCESVCGQTFSDFEWIVIDGGSTDGTLEIFAEYRDRIDVLVSESDDGIYNAMNKGIGRASGEYVVFMNGGDRFADQEVLASVAAVPRRDIIFGDLGLEGTDDEVKKYPDTLRKNYLLKEMMPHQASFFRRALFGKYGLLDESFKIAADYDLFVRLIHIGKVSYHHIPQTLAVFDETGVSSDPKMRALRKRENHRVRMKYFPRYRLSFKALRQLIRNRRELGIRK